jgi:2-polyprenyl-3-methyl-5-hydroxy-6-metoxy-1,4-benzoquinol methylase
MVETIANHDTDTRFAFGKNWRSFIEIVDDARIAAACDSLCEALHIATLSGRTFLDVGSGSGLFSLAACQLGARVRSFDFDPDSVQATADLRRRFAADSDWLIEQGSVLDSQFVAGLGHYDIVYSWGVLHHTGQLWKAMDETSRLVAPSGLLYVSIYNDQGLTSKVWRQVKRRYSRSGPAVRSILTAGAVTYLAAHRLRYLPFDVKRRLASARLPRPGHRRPERGMSRRHDLIDWIGGYPFEVAKPDEVFSFLHCRGFELRHLKTWGGGAGCNEYVFQAVPRSDSASASQDAPAGKVSESG